MKYFLLLSIVFISCSSNDSGKNFETRIKNYMKDSVATSMHDPSSYEFVSMKLDSVYNHDLTQEYLTDDSTKLAERKKIAALDPDRYSENGNQLLQGNIERYKKELSEPDFLYRVYADVKFRAKNKLGALVLNDVRLVYNPSKDKIERKN